MADYVDDSGTHNYDALLGGTEDTDWSRDTANKTLKMLTATGEADTGFILPSNEPWLLIETYDVGETGSGNAGWLGFHKYQSDVSQVGTDLASYRSTVDAEYPFYKMKATWFDGSSTAKVYEANDTTAFPAEGSPTYTVTSYTPPVTNWKMTDTLTAPAQGAVYGAELFPDPNFVDGTGLVAGSGTTISSGMTLTNTSTDTVTSSALVTTGDVIRFVINVSVLTTAGTIRFGYGQYQYQYLQIDSTGEYVIDCISEYTSQSGKITIGDGTFAGTLSSCSVKVLQSGEQLDSNVLLNSTFSDATNWTLSTGWSITGGELVCTTGAGTNNVKGDLSVSPAVNDIFKVIVEVSEYTSGNAQIQIGGAGATCWMYPASATTYTYYLTETAADTDVLKITANTSAFKITSITVQKVLS